MRISSFNTLWRGIVKRRKKISRIIRRAIIISIISMQLAKEEKRKRRVQSWRSPFFIGIN